MKNEELLHAGAIRNGAVWAALAFSAGLVLTPTAALAEESAGGASALAGGGKRLNLRAG